VEIAALRGRARDLEKIAERKGIQLPAFGRVAVGPNQLALCVRPERWLLLAPPASPGATAGVWQAACAGCGVAIDLSSGLSALHLAGPAAREMLVRGCRLDLDPAVFPPGRAAATIMAQVSVILASLASGMLLLTPSSTSRHFREWLTSTARPFGFMPRSDLAVAVLSGDEWR
jgi:sarcosine oxidase subunit gamma